MVRAVIGAALAGCGADPVSRPPFGETSLPDGGTGDGSRDDAGAASSSNDAGAAKPDSPYFGANLEPGGVVFRVWAPRASAARVTGDFAATPVAMTALAGGVFEAHAPGAHAGQAYAFSFDTSGGVVTRVDPHCRAIAGSSCTIVDPASFAWKTGTFARPSRASTIVYELHVGSFAVPSGAPYGTFQSARTALPALGDLGVNVIELMPVQSFGAGPEGWGYNPQLYFAPKPTYGTPDDLRALVDDAHALGIAVWIDVVANHMDGWNGAPLRCFDAPCPEGSAGTYFFPAGTYAMTPWGPRPNYDEPEVASMLGSMVDWWVGEFHGDGFRWDSVSNIRALDGNGSVPGGKDLLAHANDHAHALGAASVAEDLKGYAAITQTTSAGGFGFDAQWDGFGYTMTAALAPASDAGRDLGQVAGALTGTYGGDGFARLIFTEDHDTVGNGGARLPSKIDPANPTSLAARKRSMLGAVMLFTAPGVPMIFQGQEALATGTFADPPAPLSSPTPQGRQIRAFYKDLIRLRKNADGGAMGLEEPGIEIFHRNDAAKILAYRRYGASGEDVIVIVNLMNKAYTEYDIGVPSAGPWRIRLDTESTAYSDDFGAGQTGTVTAHAGTKDGKPFTLPLELAAYGAMVITR